MTDFIFVFMHSSTVELFYYYLPLIRHNRRHNYIYIIKQLHWNCGVPLLF